MKINNFSRIKQLDDIFSLALILPITDKKFGVEIIVNRSLIENDQNKVFNHLWNDGKVYSINYNTIPYVNYSYTQIIEWYIS